MEIYRLNQSQLFEKNVSHNDIVFDVNKLIISSVRELSDDEITWVANQALESLRYYFNYWDTPCVREIDVINTALEAHRRAGIAWTVEFVPEFESRFFSFPDDVSEKKM